MLAAWLTRLRSLPLAQFLSAYLVAGLLLTGICLWLFWRISRAVLADSIIVAFDLALASELHLQATPFTTSLYRLVSWFGGTGLLIVGIIVSLFFILRRQWLSLAFWLIALAGGGLLNTFLKATFARPRPVFLEPLVIETYYSFPSAHAMTSFITFGVLAYFLWSEVKHRYARIFIIFGVTLLVILIGISRLTLGVHYFSDVLGGFAAGGFWSGICITALNLIKRRQVSLISEPAASKL